MLPNLLSIWENVLCELGKNVYSAALGWNDLNMNISVRYIYLVESVVQVHCFLIDFMYEWSIYCWKWGIEIPYCYCIEVYFYPQFGWLINIWRDAQPHSLLVKCKSKLQYHFTPDRMTIIKKSQNHSCWRGYGEKGTLLYCWWECKLIQPLWRTLWRFLKKLGIRD